VSRGTFVHFFYLSLFACAALAGCASTEQVAPVVDRTAVRTETKPVERRANDTRGPQSGSQSAKTEANSDGAAKSSNKNTNSETQSSNRNAQTETHSDGAGQSPGSETNGATQSAAKRPTESVKETAPRQNSQGASKPYRAGDWRPEYHTVRKGDTLYSIALDFGQDYRDLARWNALADPSYIQIGQQLRLFPAGGGGAIPPAASATVGKPLPGAEHIPTFSDPKAFRVIYSEQAYAELQRMLAGETETTVVRSKPATTATVQQPAQAAKPASVGAPKSTQTGRSDERMSWEWPAPGKVLYEFSAGPNKKGVSIQGKPGQAVVSSAPGKVVYSGSGLRGYGNLIIIKHNATYLSVYAHNSQLLVREGQMVAQGQRIAVMGKAGGTTALHFEIRRLGKPIDPRSRLPARAS
jgi:lipoprotein NlpD